MGYLRLRYCLVVLPGIAWPYETAVLSSFDPMRAGPPSLLSPVAGRSG
jgi:hypothetical protein